MTRSAALGLGNSQQRLPARSSGFTWSRSDGGEKWASERISELHSARRPMTPFQGYGPPPNAAFTQQCTVLMPPYVQNVASAPGDGMVRFRRDLARSPQTRLIVPASSGGGRPSPSRMGPPELSPSRPTTASKKDLDRRQEELSNRFDSLRTQMTCVHTVVKKFEERQNLLGASVFSPMGAGKDQGK